MKRINKYVIAGLSLTVAACQEFEPASPAFDVKVDKTTYSIGEEVKFYLSGDADFVTFYHGEDNWTSSITGSTYAGSRYVYRNRGYEKGVCLLQFNNKKANTATVNGSLRLMLSLDFNGGNTMEDIQAATWTDISDLATWSTTTSDATARVYLEDYAGQTINVAWVFTSPDGSSKYGWTLGSVTLRNTVDTDANAYILWSKGSLWKFGRASNSVNPATGQMQGLWTTVDSPAVNGPNTSSTEGNFESWLLSGKFDPSEVTADLGVKVKSYSESIPDFWSHQYWKAGTYDVTFVASNSNTFGSGEAVRTLQITVE